MKLLALFFFMPFLSVRNLVEMVSAPLLMLSGWWLLKALPSVSSGSGRSEPTLAPATAPVNWLYAGMFAGLAINIRSDGTRLNDVVARGGTGDHNPGAAIPRNPTAINHIVG